MEYVTITHPFHPFKGKRFKVLFSRTINDQDILSLRAIDPDAKVITIEILRDWTDIADPSPYQDCNILPPILSFKSLQKLTDLVIELRKKLPTKKTKGIKKVIDI